VLNQEFLKQTLLFENLSEEELLDIIMIGHVKTYKAGTTLFREGDPGDTLYLIVSGSVRISKMHGGTEEALAVLDAKSFFGEMTLFDRQPRSAYAIVHEDAEVFAIPAEALVKLFHDNKELGFKVLWTFGQTLANRLRLTNEKFEVIMSLANDGF